MDDSIHEHNIGNIRVHDNRSLIRSQVISHCSIQNYLESADDDERSVFMSHTRPSTSHYSVVLVISLGFDSYGHVRSGHRSHTSQFS